MLEIVYLTIAEVEAMTGLKRWSIYSKMREQGFPNRFKFGTKSVRWKETEVLEWLRSRNLPDLRHEPPVEAGLNNLELVTINPCSNDDWSIDKLLSASKPINTKADSCGVYFLFNEGELIYVGKTIGSVFVRIGEHYAKEFDSYHFMHVPTEYLELVEAYFIFKFRPKENGVHPRGAMRTSRKYASVVSANMNAVFDAIKVAQP